MSIIVRIAMRVTWLTARRAGPQKSSYHFQKDVPLCGGF
jgi:hypothetical protein